MIRAVLFDAVGTLIAPCPTVGEAYTAAGARWGEVLPQEVVRERFLSAFRDEETWDRQQLAGRTDQRRELERWQRIVADVFPNSAHAAELFADLWSHFARANNWRLFDDAAEVLAELTNRGIAWGIASNFDGRLREICQQMPELASCQHLFASADVGWRKPCAQFFRHIEQALQREPGEILLVGDDFDNDYRAAVAAGWHAIWLRREVASQSSVASAATISQLTELTQRGDLVGFTDSR